MKGFLIAAFLFFVTAIEAQEVVKLSVNHIVVKVVRPQSNVVSEVYLNLKKYRPIKSFGISISSENIAAVYKRRLEITDTFDSTLIFSSTDVLKKETFVFDPKKMSTIFATHKELHIYELMEPSNPMMRIRSKRDLLLNLHIN